MPPALVGRRRGGRAARRRRLGCHRRRDAFLGLVRRGEAGVAALDVLDRRRRARAVRARVARCPQPPATRSVPPLHRRRAPRCGRVAGVDVAARGPERSTRSRPSSRPRRPIPSAVAARRVAPRHRQGRPRRARAGGRRGRAGPGRRDGSRAARRRARLLHGRRASAPARHRDTPGPHRREPVLDAAATIGTVERLAALYLPGGRRRRRHRSRGVDAMAAGARPRARDKVRHVLERGTMGVELAATLAERTGGVRALLTGEPDGTSTPSCCGCRVATSCRSSPLARRGTSARSRRSSPPTRSAPPPRRGAAGTYELLVVTNDRPALLSSVAGALAVGGISILSAQVFTTTTTSPSTSSTSKASSRRRSPEARWRSFRTTLRRVIEGAITIERKVEEMRRHYPAPSIHTPVTVRADHDASDFSTVLEVGAPDRMGCSTTSPMRLARRVSMSISRRSRPSTDGSSTPSTFVTSWGARSPTR